MLLGLIVLAWIVSLLARKHPAFVSIDIKIIKLILRSFLNQDQFYCLVESLVVRVEVLRMSPKMVLKQYDVDASMLLMNTKPLNHICALKVVANVLVLEAPILAVSIKIAKL